MAAIQIAIATFIRNPITPNGADSAHTCVVREFRRTRSFLLLFVIGVQKKRGRGRHHGDGEGDGDGDGNGDGPTPRGGDGNGDGDGNGNGHGAGDGGFDYYGNYPDFVFFFFLRGKSLWHFLQEMVLVPVCAWQLGHSLHIFLPQAHSLFFLRSLRSLRSLRFLSGKSLWHVLQTLVLVPACALQLGHSLHSFLPQAHSLRFLPWAFFLCGRG